jgi:hypothetical protein
MSGMEETSLPIFRNIHDDITITCGEEKIVLSNSRKRSHGMAWHLIFLDLIILIKRVQIVELLI